MNSKTITKILLSSTMIFSFLYSVAQGPTFQWAKIMSGSYWTYTRDIETDNQGNVYNVGVFSGTLDCDPSSSTYSMTAMGYGFALISKLDGSGNFLWAKKFESTGFSEVFGIAVDANDNIYVTGIHKGVTDFDPGVGTYTLTSNAAYTSGFMCKLDAMGNFIWAKDFNSVNTCFPFATKVDLAGNVYLTGRFADVTDFDPGIGTYTLTTPSGVGHTFVTKLSGNGNFIWTKVLASVGSCTTFDMDLDGNGNIVVAGIYSVAIDCDPSAATHIINSVGVEDMFITKLDSGGNFIWGKGMGSPHLDHIWALSIDGYGNVYTTGYFQDSVDFDPGPNTHYLHSYANMSAFIQKLNPSGDLIWVKSPTDSITQGWDIVVDGIGDAYITGMFMGTVDFDPDSTTNYSTWNGWHDIFILKLDSGGAFSWVKTFGDTIHDTGQNIALDQNHNIFSSGFIWGTVDMDPGNTVCNLYSQHCAKSFYVHKMGDCSIPNEALNITPNSLLNICEGNTTTLTASGSGSLYWYTSPTGTVVVGSGATLFTPTLSSGIHTYFVEAKTCGSAPRVAISILVNANPVISTTSNSFIICAGQTTTLFATGANSYTWNPGGITNSIVVTPNSNLTFTIEGTDNIGCYGTSIVTQSVAVCTGLSSNTQHDIFRLYPNPTNGKFFVETPENSEIEIVNSLGEIIYRNVTAEKLTLVNQENLQPGIYIIYVKNDLQVAKKKLLIQ